MTQTVRYFASSLGMAVLGTVLINETRSRIISSLGDEGVPRTAAAGVAADFSAGASAGQSPHSAAARRVFTTIQSDFAQATKVVFLAMAAVMAVCLLVAARGMELGVPEEVSGTATALAALEAAEGGAPVE